MCLSLSPPRAQASGPCAITWYVVPKANSGEGDDHEVERLQNRPVLHPLEHEGGHGEED